MVFLPTKGITTTTTTTTTATIIRQDQRRDITTTTITTTGNQCQRQPRRTERERGVTIRSIAPKPTLAPVLLGRIRGARSDDPADIAIPIPRTN